MSIEITGGTGAPGPAGPAGPATTGLPATYLLRVNASSQVEAYNSHTGATDYTGATLDVVTASIVTALAGAAATLAFAPQTFTLAADPNLPASIGVALPKGALLSHGANALHILGHVAAGPYQLFSGTGTVTLSNAIREGYAEWWGAKRDGVVLTDVSATNASAVVTSASASFSSADVGKSAIVYDPVAMAVVASGYPSVSTALTIASVQSATQCTLSGAAVASGTNCVMVYGSDDTAPVAAAIAALSAVKATLLGLPGVYVGGTGTTVSVNGSNQGLIWRPVSNTRIRGAGKGRTTYASTVYHQQVFLAYQASAVEYRDFTVRSDGAGADGLKNLSVTSLDMHDLSGVHNCYSFKAMGCQNFQFSHLDSTGDYVDPITSAGGYGMQIIDLNSLALIGTKGVRGFGLKSTGSKYGVLHLAGDTTIASKPTGIVIGGIAADTCGYGQTALPNVLLDWVDAPVLNGVRMLKGGVGYQSQHGPNRVKVTGAVAEQCYGQGFIAYGDSYGQYDTIDAFDCNQGNIGLIAGILFEDDGSAVGSTNNVVTNARSGVRTWRQVTDGVTTSGSPNVSSATASFASTDVGMVIVAGTVVTTIASVTDSSHAVMVANANATATGVTFQIGTAPAHQGYQSSGANTGNNRVVASDFTSACSSKGTVNAKATDVLLNNSGDTSTGGNGTVTPGTSPWTYTAGNHREYHYISGGTVSSITSGGVNQGLTTPATLILEPGMAYVMTYSSAPTVVRRTV